MGPAQKLLEAAAAPTLERIRQDRQKAPTQIQPLLAYLETHLFDPDLDANQLKRACGVRDNSLPIYFHHALSLPPYAYIEDCRLEVACRLLCDSKLKIWQIAQLLGYSTLQVFSRAFHRWSGLRPSVFRRRARLERQENARFRSRDEAASDDLLIEVSTMRKAATGGLGKDEADELARRLAQLYPDSFGRPTVDSAPSHMDRLPAPEAWTLLQARPERERRDFVLGSWRVASAELFHLLVEKSIEICRRDTRQGAEVARLALGCLDAIAETLPAAEHRQLQVRGWAWLANAHRLAVDLPESEEALRKAESALRTDCDHEIRTELTLIKSAVRMTQRRLGEALTLADQAVSMIAAVGQPNLRMRCLVHRAHLLYTLGRVSEGIPDLWKAFEMVDRVDDPYLKIPVYQGLSLSLALEGEHRRAVSYLPAARALCQELKIEKVLSYLEWTEGLLARDLGQPESAEVHFQVARTGFYEQEQSYLGALTALDLAILYADQGRLSDIPDLAAEVIRVFESYKIHHEALMAMQLLRQVSSAQEASVATLRKIRSLVSKIRPSRS